MKSILFPFSGGRKTKSPASKDKIFETSADNNARGTTQIAVKTATLRAQTSPLHSRSNHGKVLPAFAIFLPAREIQMHPETQFMARTNRHFSETGCSFAFSVTAFQWIVPILSHFFAFVNE
ncbi:MAG: hypothetical protein IJA26_02990 [Clostridia bacterium]|nr:hypothetical protein [Clostridia bacterium]